MLFRVLGSVLGAIVLAWTFQQIFLDLFHPSAQGSFSDFIARGLWRVMSRKKELLAGAGPLALVAVILGWSLLVGFGFALIYWPAFPGNFRFAGRPETGFLTALYFSLGALTTLGSNDIVPQALWIRYVASFEAMIGLGLLTASVSWIVVLYPALGRMRLLARQSMILIDAARRTQVDAIGDDSEALLHDLTEKVIQTRIELIYFPILYYFRAAQSQASLAEALPPLVRFSDEGMKDDSPPRLRFAATALRCAIEDLSHLLDERFLRAGDQRLESVLKAFAADHQIGG